VRGKRNRPDKKTNSKEEACSAPESPRAAVEIATLYSRTPRKSRR
jgi:hypothetical protein